MRSLWRSGGTAVLALVATLGAAVPAAALHRNTPGVIRVTKGASISLPPTRSWSYVTAFTSTDDVLATGSTGRQVYVFGLFEYDCGAGVPGPALKSCRGRPAIAQVTTGPGNPDNPSVGSHNTLVAFDADGAYGGGTGPGVGHRQIFVLNRVTQQLTRITDAADGDSIHPTIDEKTPSVVFESTASLIGGGSGVSQIFVYDAKPQTITQLTTGAGPSTHPIPTKISAGVAFESTAALRGDGHDTGMSQIFWYDRKKATLVQITNGNGPSRRPWPTSKLRVEAMPGTLAAKIPPPAVLFESDATNLPGSTGVAGSQLYVASTRLGDAPPVRQLTPVSVVGCTPASPGAASFPALESTGRRITFLSTADPLCNGTTGSRLFVLDVSQSPVLLRQITGRGDVSGPVATPLGVWFAGALTTDDLTGGGVCGHQLQVVDFFTGGWKAASTPGTSPVEPVAGDPSAACDDGDACTADACLPGGCQHTPIPGCP